MDSTGLLQALVVGTFTSTENATIKKNEEWRISAPLPDTSSVDETASVNCGGLRGKR